MVAAAEAARLVWVSREQAEADIAVLLGGGPAARLDEAAVVIEGGILVTGEHVHLRDAQRLFPAGAGDGVDVVGVAAAAQTSIRNAVSPAGGSPAVFRRI